MSKTVQRAEGVAVRTPLICWSWKTYPADSRPWAGVTCVAVDHIDAIRDFGSNRKVVISMALLSRCENPESTGADEEGTKPVSEWKREPQKVGAHASKRTEAHGQW